MSLSKEFRIAEALNSVDASNLRSAVGQQYWIKLVNELFCSSDVSSSDESDSEVDNEFDSQSNEGNDTDDDSNKKKD